MIKIDYSSREDNFSGDEASGGIISLMIIVFVIIGFFI